MSIILKKAYQGFISGATVTLPVEVEAALVAQGMAAYGGTGGVNPAASPPPLSGAITAGTYGPAVVTNIPIGNSALDAFETDGVVQTAWNTNVTEIWVPHWNTWTGAAVLNGTTVGSNTYMLYLFNTAGYLIQHTAIAGTATAGASVFQKIAFNVPVTLSPGRYFIGVSVSAATDTVRHALAAFGAEPRCAVIATITSHAVATATLKAAPITVPTTYTTALAPIVQLYS